jgi:tRNA pseudouridine38-40 synthase
LNNYKLLIQYDGTNYFGWQMQAEQVTIQQKITEAVEIILKEKIKLIGSGRTDTGVHALGQTANFKTANDLDIYKFTHSINAILPKDISILKIEKVNPEFHSRFDAKKRSYLYLISKYKSPFFDKYSYFYHNEIDCNLLNNLSRSLLGMKDFSSFARKNTETKNKICNIYEAYWRCNSNLIIFKIEADRFLHGMVRTITGTLLKSLKNNHDNSYVEDIIKLKDREAAGEAVPAKGLFLFKVKY